VPRIAPPSHHCSYCAIGVVPEKTLKRHPENLWLLNTGAKLPAKRRLLPFQRRLPVACLDTARACRCAL